jgi:protein TonB
MGYGVEREYRWIAAAMAASMGLHLAGVLLFPPAVHGLARAVRPPTDVIDIETAPAPSAPAVEPPPPPQQPAPKSAPSRAAPKALAQAGQVVTATAPPGPLDFTGGFVTGTATAYAGGTTAAGGMSRTVVRGAPDPPGPAAGGGGTGANLSRTASLSDESSWHCPFPPEADAIDEAIVELRVFVGANGEAQDAVVITDPGHGFGAAALRCAIGKRWKPALDRHGNPVPATAIVRVRFTR